MNQIIKVGIGIMILNDNKILLGHRTEGSKSIKRPFLNVQQEKQKKRQILRFQI